MEKRKLNPSARRSRIALINALIHLMQVKSFQKISIQEITDTAELSRQTLYTNFTSKEDILKYSLNKLFEMFEHDEENIDIEEYLKTYFLYWKENSIILEVLFKQSLDHLFIEKNISYFNQQRDLLKMNITDEEKVYLQNCLASLTYTLLRTWILENKKDSVEFLVLIGMKIIQGSYFDKNVK